MNLQCRAHGRRGRRHYRDYTGTQSLSLHYEAEGRGRGCGWGCGWGGVQGFLWVKPGTFLPHFLGTPGQLLSKSGHLATATCQR